MRYARSLLAAGANQHHAARVDRGFLAHDAARHALAARLLMALHNRDAFHNHFALARESLLHLASFAFAVALVAGNDDNGIPGFHMKLGCTHFVFPPYSTSGASETIFI